MKKIIDGFIRAIFSTITGLIISIISKESVSSILQNEILGSLTALAVFTLSIYVAARKMKFWGILYTMGWIIGLGIMYYSMASVIELYEIILYPLMSGLILYAKIKNKI